MPRQLHAQRLNGRDDLADTCGRGDANDGQAALAERTQRVSRPFSILESVPY
eukprot:COSAG01_NODE_2061_length_8482_cov_6.301925_13_plen_52_part_00